MSEESTPADSASSPTEEAGRISHPSTKTAAKALPYGRDKRKNYTQKLFTLKTKMPSGIFQPEQKIRKFYQVSDIPLAWRDDPYAKFWTRQSELVQHFPKPPDREQARTTTTKQFPRYPTCLLQRAKTPSDRITVINWWLSIDETTQKYWLKEGLKKIFYSPQSSDHTIEEHAQLVTFLNCQPPVAPPSASSPPPQVVTTSATETTPIMRKLEQANAELKKENIALKKENEALKEELTKRKAQDTIIAGQKPSKKGRTLKQRKKLFEKWHKLLIRNTARAKNFAGSTFPFQTTDTHWSIDDFQAVFRDKGTIIQPTPKNKPNSRIVIVQFNDIESIQILFDDTPITKDRYAFELWRKENFSHSTKLEGQHPAEIGSLLVKYDKSVLSLTLEFTMIVVRNELIGAETN
eukprot:scaffold13509_cov157-Amphora_coffeaeformis.AAC.6